jgi:hypothetical protein
VLLLRTPAKSEMLWWQTRAKSGIFGKGHVSNPKISGGRHVPNLEYLAKDTCQTRRSLVADTCLIKCPYILTPTHFPERSAMALRLNESFLHKSIDVQSCASGNRWFPQNCFPQYAHCPITNVTLAVQHAASHSVLCRGNLLISFIVFALAFVPHLNSAWSCSQGSMYSQDMSMHTTSGALLWHSPLPDTRHYLTLATTRHSPLDAVLVPLFDCHTVAL